MADLKVGVTTEYRNIRIDYLEDSNKWRFELRGRERKADTLAQAKEWIDKPEPVKKASKTFKRFEALMAGSTFYGGYSEKNRRVVTVTSAAQDLYRGTNTPCTAWILDGKDRSKISVEKLFEISEENDRKWGEYDFHQLQIAELEKKSAAILKSLKRIDLTAYIDNQEES